MEKPFARFAVHPCQGAACGLGNEVIAFRVVSVPPARLDPLGTGKELELRLGHPSCRIEQPCRPRSGWGCLARLPFARLYLLPGMLRAMVGRSRKAMDGIAAQACPQALDELHPVF